MFGFGEILSVEVDIFDKDLCISSMKSIDKIVTKIYSVTRRIRSLPPKELTPALPDQYPKSHTIFPRNHTHPAILIDETYPRHTAKQVNPFAKNSRPPYQNTLSTLNTLSFFLKNLRFFKKYLRFF